MTELFADTYFWLALLNPADANHQRVLNHPAAGRLVTSDAVRIEVMDALCKRRSRPLAIKFWRTTARNPNIYMAPVDTSLLQRSALLYESRPDKDWSLTDCISFVIMQDRGITDALTGDHHFEQARFTALLK